MPTIAVVRGVLIVLYPNDHGPPHFHARGADFEARIAIADGAMTILRGRPSSTIRRALADWSIRNRLGLLDNWHRLRRGEAVVRLEDE